MSCKVEFNLSKLQENIDELKNNVKGINFLFPVKCCNNSEVLDVIANNGFGFDISNNNEFDIIKKYLNNQFVSASSPLAIELVGNEYSNLHIVANNLNAYSSGMGLRINFNSSNKFEKSRFGVDYRKLDDTALEKIEYIHFHNSDHRTLEKCEDIYKEFNIVLEKFKNLKYINIGGHLEDLSFEEGINYLKNMRKLIPDNIKVFVELGDFLFKGTGTLFCEVVDIRNDDDCQVVTLNFSKMANQRWAYPIYREEKQNEDLINTIFYGCSCCETDIYLETKARKLKVGDRLKFYNISPYSYQWDTSFNGIMEMKYIFK